MAGFTASVTNSIVAITVDVAISRGAITIGGTVATTVITGTIVFVTSPAIARSRGGRSSNLSSLASDLGSKKSDYLCLVFNGSKSGGG